METSGSVQRQAAWFQGVEALDQLQVRAETICRSMPQWPPPSSWTLGFRHAHAYDQNIRRGSCEWCAQGSLLEVCRSNSRPCHSLRCRVGMQSGLRVVGSVRRPNIDLEQVIELNKREKSINIAAETSKQSRDTSLAEPKWMDADGHRLKTIKRCCCFGFTRGGSGCALEIVSEPCGERKHPKATSQLTKFGLCIQQFRALTSLEHEKRNGM